VEVPRKSRKSARESDKLVSRMHRAPSNTGDSPGAYIFWMLSQPKSHSAAVGIGLNQ
jgi:hypothetical protein